MKCRRRNKRISSPVLKREKSDPSKESTDHGILQWFYSIDISHASFVLQPNSGMRSIAKLISNFKNSKTHREQGGLTKQNLTKINNVYSKLPERNNISTLGMEYLKKEKEDFIKLRQKHFSVMVIWLFSKILHMFYISLF